MRGACIIGAALLWSTTVHGIEGIGPGQQLMQSKDARNNPAVMNGSLLRLDQKRGVLTDPTRFSITLSPGTCTNVTNTAIHSTSHVSCHGTGQYGPLLNPMQVEGGILATACNDTHAQRPATSATVWEGGATLIHRNAAGDETADCVVE